MWRVLRHGGRAGDSWRTVMSTPDELGARERYQALYTRLRQGGLALIDPSGTQVLYHWAPRLRSRW